MSKRVTQAKRPKRHRSTCLPHIELVSRRAGVDRRDLPQLLANAVDDDPFEIIGFASIAASTLQHDVGKLFDELADQDPRLGPVLSATVASLPFVDHFSPERIVNDVLPSWLANLNDATVTGMMRRVMNEPHHESSYLVEVTMYGDLVATGVFGLDHRGPAAIDAFCTVAAPMLTVAEHYETKLKAQCSEAYDDVALAEGVQSLLMALDESMNDTSHRNMPLSPWPANLPVAAFALDMAMGQIRNCDLPYVELRRTTSGRDPKAKAVRRSLQRDQGTD